MDTGLLFSELRSQLQRALTARKKSKDRLAAIGAVVGKTDNDAGCVTHKTAWAAIQKHVLVYPDLRSPMLKFVTVLMSHQVLD